MPHGGKLAIFWVRLLRSYHDSLAINRAVSLCRLPKRAPSETRQELGASAWGEFRRFSVLRTVQSFSPRRRSGTGRPPLDSTGRNGDLFWNSHVAIPAMSYEQTSFTRRSAERRVEYASGWSSLSRRGPAFLSTQSHDLLTGQSTEP